MIKKIVNSLFAVALFTATTVSVEARSLDEILKSGVIKMGVNPAYLHLLNMMKKII